jgi:hypothetical protein
MNANTKVLAPTAPKPDGAMIEPVFDEAVTSGGVAPDLAVILTAADLLALRKGLNLVITVAGHKVIAFLG